jgi:hypothetical protein
MSEAEPMPDPEEAVELLIDADVLAHEGPEFRITASFERLVDQKRAEVAGASESAVTEYIERTTDDERLEQVVAEIGVVDNDFLAYYLALSERAPKLPSESRARTVLLLQQSADDPPREDGTPDGFVPVKGNQLETITKLTPASIVYIWREDCTPCDQVKTTLEEMFDSTSTGVGLFSVYGPAHAEYLHREFDVKGGPVTLFMTRDDVDSRVFGAKPRRIYEGEVEELRRSL